MRQILVDSMLGRLAKWLRLMGLDTVLLVKPPLRIMPHQIFLTRRTKLIHKQGVLFIEDDLIEDQMVQVIRALGLKLDRSCFFSRCLMCNIQVRPAQKHEIADQVPDYTLHSADHFTFCPKCGRVFWPGSHGQRALKKLEHLFNKANFKH